MIEAFGDAIPLHIRTELAKEDNRLPWELKGSIIGTRGDQWVPMVIEYAAKHWGVENPPPVDDYWTLQENILSSFGDRVEECKGATHLVQSLANLQVPMAIATSSRMVSVEKKRVRHEAIFQHMETIVSGDDALVKNGKPAPDIYLEAASRLNVDPKDCLVFEDAVAGCRSGKAAGCRVIAVPDPRMDNSVFDGVADQVLDDLTFFDGDLWGMGTHGLN